MVWRMSWRARRSSARAGVRPALRLDAFEEYFPLVARDLRVSTALVPVALLAVPLVGAMGAALGGQANRLGAGALAIVLATVPPCSQERRQSRIRWLWSASRCTTACTARSWWSPTPACRNGSRDRLARR
jgi:hypothetical protein